MRIKSVLQSQQVEEEERVWEERVRGLRERKRGLEEKSRGKGSQ